MLSISLPFFVLIALALLWFLVYRYPAKVSSPAGRIGMVMVTALLSFILVGGLSFGVAMFLAGPHADILPQAYAPFVFLVAIVMAIAVPVLAALTVARRLRGGTLSTVSDPRHPP